MIINMIMSTNDRPAYTTIGFWVGNKLVILPDDINDMKINTAANKLKLMGGL